VIETAALIQPEEREKEAIGVLAFEHEVDTEEGGGKDINEVGDPDGQGGDEIAGRGRKRVFGTDSEGVKTHAVSKGNVLEMGDDAGETLGEFGAEVAEVSHERGKADSEKDGEDEDDSDDEKNDSYGAAGPVLADGGVHDAADNGHEDNGEKGTDVDDEEFFTEFPAEKEKEKDTDGKNYVATDIGANL
jgi:hypothetical protein